MSLPEYKTGCTECDYCLNHEDPDKWGAHCGACGRSKAEREDILEGRVHLCPVESDPLVSWQEKCPPDDREEDGWYILVQRDAWVRVYFCPHCGEKLPRGQVMLADTLDLCSLEKDGKPICAYRRENADLREHLRYLFYYRFAIGTKMEDELRERGEHERCKRIYELLKE